MYSCRYISLFYLVICPVKNYNNFTAFHITVIMYNCHLKINTNRSVNRRHYKYIIHPVNNYCNYYGNS